MSYAIEWMKNGRTSESLKGIEKRSDYQRSDLVDMDILLSLDIQP